MVSLYFQVDTLLPGETFFGGFYTDLRANFTSAIDNATFHFYLQDPAGQFLFDGEHYSLADALNFEVSTVPLSADFGAGQVDGQIMEIQIVPEPFCLDLL